jgi:putative DNA primase/helicase
MSGRAEEEFRHEVFSVVGHDPGPIEAGKIIRFSSNGKPSDDSGWCRLFDDLRGGVYGDFRTGVSSHWTATPREQMSPLARSAWLRQLSEHRAATAAQRQASWKEAEGYIAHLWNECQPVTRRDPVDIYLRCRLAVEAFAPPDCLRLHPSLSYSHNGQRIGSFPAMVAPVTDAAGKILALHRTYLDAKGRKATVPGAVKKLTSASGPLMGGSIKFYGPEGARIGVAEGIETALAAYLGSGIPTQAAYSAGALAAYKWPEGVRRLLVFGDADETGRAAAEDLRHRCANDRVVCLVMTPDTEGTDWADVWASREDVSA